MYIIDKSTEDQQIFSQHIPFAALKRELAPIRVVSFFTTYSCIRRYLPRKGCGT
jgi:hypothetical protein